MTPRDLPHERPYSVAAIVSLVTGLICCLPFVTGVTAIITGIVGIRVTGTNGTRRGRGMAIAGLVLGLVSLLGWALFGTGVIVTAARSGEPTAAATQFVQHLEAGEVDEAMNLTVQGFPKTQLVPIADALADGPMRTALDVSDTKFFAQLSGSTTWTIVLSAAYADGSRRVYTVELVADGQGGYGVRHVYLTPMPTLATQPATQPTS